MALMIHTMALMTRCVLLTLWGILLLVCIKSSEAEAEQGSNPLMRSRTLKRGGSAGPVHSPEKSKKLNVVSRILGRRKRSESPTRPHVNTRNLRRGEHVPHDALTEEIKEDIDADLGTGVPRLGHKTLARNYPGEGETNPAYPEEEEEAYPEEEEEAYPEEEEEAYPEEEEEAYPEEEEEAYPEEEEEAYPEEKEEEYHEEEEEQHRGYPEEEYHEEEEEQHRGYPEEEYHEEDQEQHRGYPEEEYPEEKQHRGYSTEEYPEEQQHRGYPEEEYPEKEQHRGYPEEENLENNTEGRQPEENPHPEHPARPLSPGGGIVVNVAAGNSPQAVMGTVQTTPAPEIQPFPPKAVEAQESMAAMEREGVEAIPSLDQVLQKLTKMENDLDKLKTGMLPTAAVPTVSSASPPRVFKPKFIAPPAAAAPPAASVAVPQITNVAGGQKVCCNDTGAGSVGDTQVQTKGFEESTNLWKRIDDLKKRIENMPTGAGASSEEATATGGREGEGGEGEGGEADEEET